MHSRDRVVSDTEQLSMTTPPIHQAEGSVPPVPSKQTADKKPPVPPAPDIVAMREKWDKIEQAAKDRADAEAAKQRQEESASIKRQTIETARASAEADVRTILGLDLAADAPPTEPPPPETPSRWGRWKWVAVGAGAGLLGLAGLWLWVSYWPKEEPAPSTPSAVYVGRLTYSYHRGLDVDYLKAVHLSERCEKQLAEPRRKAVCASITGSEEEKAECLASLKADSTVCKSRWHDAYWIASQMVSNCASAENWDAKKMLGELAADPEPFVAWANYETRARVYARGLGACLSLVDKTY